MRLIIITCGSKKRNTTTQAQHLYTGSYFTLQLAWALSEAPPTHIRILSAKHGLLTLTDIIEPYNTRITDDGAITAEELAKQLPHAATIETSAGADYAKVLKQAAALTNCKVIIHFADQPGIGYKAKAMKTRTALNRGRKQP